MVTKTPGRKPPKPLDRARLEALALAYAARFAVSAARLEAYLRRKLRERGWEGPADEGADPPVAAIVERFVAAGYVDDEAYARAKSGSLLRRGYGRRRVNQALDAAGIGAELREAVQPGQGGQRRAALVMARKRGFGPFGPERPDRAKREKQLAAMLRAGHPLDSARELVDAASIEAAEAWAGTGECE